MKRIALLIGLAFMGTMSMAQIVESDPYTYYGNFSVGKIKDKVRLSDVDLNIPENKALNNDKTFCVIFANEDYKREQSVPYAVHDGDVFRQYCIKTLGIPEKNVHYLPNATKNDMEYGVEWLKKSLALQKGEGKGIVYYSGHGMPNESSFNSYLLPIDGYADTPGSGYSLDQMYAELGASDAISVTYFIDACFSGADRSGEMMEVNRGVAIKSKGGQLKGNAVVFSAAKEDETAYAYLEKSHGMFTYFLLKKLQDTKGNVSYGELNEYINENVSSMSWSENKKTQTPTTNSTMPNSEWKKMKLIK